MHVLWGVLIVAVGVFMLVCAILETDFVVYRILVARARILWGDNVHWFFRIAGSLVAVFGVLVATKVV